MIGSAHRPSVCLVTPGHPATNPRLVKEADALTEAGFRVRVVAAKFVGWADEADRGFADRPWWPTIGWARFGPFAPWPRRQAMRLRRRLLRPLARPAPRLLPGLAALAFHDAVPQLARLAAAEPADLYIAHNLAALPAAARAAREHGARLGFDAEDFHRGELPDTPENRPLTRLTAAIEERYIPRCDHVTAASDGIAEAYAEALGIARPATILNTFPLSDRRGGATPAEELARERRGAGLSLYWYGQTIGPDRGLEDALEAVAHLGPGVRLHVRGGGWAGGYEARFAAHARRLGVADRVHYLPPAPPGQLVERAARHDVGLALEPGDRLNNNLATSNKILTYLVAGLAVAATDTRGQRAVMAEAPGAGFLYRPGDIVGLEVRLREWLAAPERLEAARRAAARAAETRFCWDREKTRLVEIVSKAIGPPRHATRPPDPSSNRFFTLGPFFGPGPRHGPRVGTSGSDPAE